MKKIILGILLTCSANAQNFISISQLPLGSAASSGVQDSFPYVDQSSHVTKKMYLSDIINLPSIAASIAPSRNQIITLSPTDITNQYVDLSFIANAGNLLFKFNHTLLDETIDYTLSTVSGVTRVTFAGNFATGGLSAFSSGDTIYFYYSSISGSPGPSPTPAPGSSTPNEEIITASPSIISNQYVNLSHLVIPNSLNFFFYRKMILNDDYFISTVSGVTRVTFNNDIASGGLSAIVSGETLDFTYLY